MSSFFETFSLDNCQTILTRILDTSNFTVKSCEFCPLDERKGFLGEHAFLKILYQDENGESKLAKLFAKGVPKESCNTFIIESGLFLKEAMFYQELIPKMLENGVKTINDCIPACYFVSENEYLIFEDLMQKGYRTENHFKSLSLDCVKAGLNALAKLHSSGIIFEEKIRTRTGNGCQLNGLYPKMFKESFFPETESGFKWTDAMKLTVAAEIELALEEDCSIDAENLTRISCGFIDKIRELIQPSEIYRNTICHGDLWVANFMYKYENSTPISCRIIDFQTFRYAPPAQDFMTYMYLVADKTVRGKNMEDMMEYYYEKMCDIFEEYGLRPDKLLSYEEFENSCKYYRILPAIMAINHNVLVYIPPKLLKTLFRGEMEIGNIMCEGRADIVRKCWPECQKYRNKIRETVGDLVDVFREMKLL